MFLVKITAVLIYTKPEPPEVIVTPTWQRKKEGTPATFKCTATGIPTPELSWHSDTGKNMTKDEVEIAAASGSSSITIKNISSTDNGTYTCKANNSAGTEKATGVLAVLCKYASEY